MQPTLLKRLCGNIFIRYYYEAYDVALRNAKERCKSYKQK